MIATQFEGQLKRAGGQLHRAGDLTEAAAHVDKILSDAGASRAALSDNGVVAALAAMLTAEVEWVDGADVAALLECHVGITGALCAIEETGTLMLSSAVEHSRLASLLPEVHIAIVFVDQLVVSLEDGLIRSTPNGSVPTALTMVTGPSRTADIELTLVVGVHGPKALHVVLVESRPLTELR